MKLTPRPLSDRDFWTAARTDPRLAPLWARVEADSAAATAHPPLPQANDFLAALRSNDRRRVDRFWREWRGVFASLILRRCALGIDQADADDRLVDWLWGHLNQPTWAVVAHLSPRELPRLDTQTLDLASCEMAMFFAETLEVLGPWIQSVSGTLAGSILHEIDRRVLTPYARGQSVWWDGSGERTDFNNWLGVCAGSILAACVALENLGHPRPEARAGDHGEGQHHLRLG